MLFLHNYFSKGLSFLKLIIKSNNTIEYLPWMIFKNYLNNLENIRLIKALLATKSFRNKSQWYLSFFQNLDDKFITKQTARELISVIRDTDESLIIPFERFEKYLIVYPNLFREILQVIIPLNELKQVRLTFWDDIFDKYFEFLGDSI